MFGLQEIGEWAPLQSFGGRFLDGERVSSAESRRLGLYGPSAIHQTMLFDADLVDMPSSWQGLDPVGPGDLVLSKFLPGTAAWVTASTRRRPINANCLRAVGMPGPQGFWIASVLGHPAYQTMLARRAAGSVIPRIGLRDLRDLRIPKAPEVIVPLAAEWERVSADLITGRRDLDDLRVEVESWVSDASPEVPDLAAPRFYSSATVDDSLLPNHLALAAFQIVAARQGWVTVGSLASQDTERLRGRRVEALRVLRLGHADGCLGFDLPDLEPLQHPTFRIYGRPLDADEVLLSVLGSSPKVVFHAPAVSETVWLTDHWVRFQPTEHAGAVALMLQTPAVRVQLELATTGMAQQFVPRNDLLSVRVPMPPVTLASDWDCRVRGALLDTDAARQQLDSIQTRLQGLVDACIGRSS